MLALLDWIFLERLLDLFILRVLGSLSRQILDHSKVYSFAWAVMVGSGITCNIEDGPM